MHSRIRTSYQIVTAFDGLIPAVTIIVLEKLIFSIGENTKVLKKQHQDLQRNNERGTEILSNKPMHLTDLVHLS